MLMTAVMAGCMTVHVNDSDDQPAPPRDAAPPTQPEPPPSITHPPPAVVVVPPPQGATTPQAPAPPQASRPPSSPGRAPPPDYSALATEVAIGMLGRPYELGGITPKGFDCSGLIYYAYGQLGVVVPRDTIGLRDISFAINDSQRRIGDLVFFHITRLYSHVGLYLGDDRFLHAPTAGGVVRVEKVTVNYWAKRYAGTRRLNFMPVTRASSGESRGARSE